MLKRTLDECAQFCAAAGIGFKAHLHHGDFVASAVEWTRDDWFGDTTRGYTLAVLNPPYRKISSDSRERRLLRSAGIETSNLYTAFLALAARLLEPHGQLVAITPRSFCNGPYFRPFREDMLSASRFVASMFSSHGLPRFVAMPCCRRTSSSTPSTKSSAMRR